MPGWVRLRAFRKVWGTQRLFPGPRWRSPGRRPGEGVRWRGPEEEGPTGLPRREEGEGPGRAVLWFRGTRRVKLGALQRGLLRCPVAEGVQKQRIQSGAAGEAAARPLGSARACCGAWGQPLTLPVCCGFFEERRQSSSRGWVGLDSIRRALSVRCLEPGSAPPPQMLNVATCT